jgi:hypothetical protein
MGQAIGGALPLAVGVALSPLPIIAVVLMLTGQRAKANGPAFILGWLVGLGIVGAIVLAIAGPSGASKSGSPATWVSWVKIVLGVLLLLVAIRQFRGRPRGADGEGEPQPPKWMAKINTIKPVATLGLAVVLAGANPKNLLLIIAAGAAIAQTGISGGEQAIAYAVFALVGTLGVGTPVVIYFALGARSEKLLAELKDWMSQHNAVIMAVLCFVIAAKLIGDGIGGLA